MLLMGLAEKLEPLVWLNAHSGMEALFMPYDHIASLPDDKVAQDTSRFHLERCKRRLTAVICLWGHCVAKHTSFARYKKGM